jgi:pyruvate,orthophosphate dikinase
MVELIHFNQDETVEGDDLQERFGLRGRNMVQLADLKTPIAPGFLIDSQQLASGALEEQLNIQSLESAVKKIEHQTGKTFNAPDRPLLFKVVISPSIQIGSIRSVHTVGISDAAAQGFAKYCGEEFAYHEYRRFMEEVSTRYLGKKMTDFTSLSQANPKASHKEICSLYRQKVVPDFPQNGYEQLRTVLTAMAHQYKEDPMNEDIEAGLLVQMMVYGNFGENSYNGSFYTRDIVTGDSRLSGYFGHNEFDTPQDQAQDITKMKPEYLRQLQQVATLLEEKYLDIRQIKFVIEDNVVWMVEQNPVDAKSTQAEVRTLLDLYKKGLVGKDKVTRTIPPTQLQDLLHPVIDHATTQGMVKITGGLAGSPGAAVGRVCFSTPKLLAEFRRCSLAGLNSDLILIMPHTDAEDVEAIELGRAVVASVGGYASHAPVVARSLRKPCLLFEDIEFKDDYALVGGNRVNELDTVSLEVPTYTDPTIWVGKAELVFPDTSTNGLEDYIGAIGEASDKFAVLGSASNESEIEVAFRLGAQGIGLFPIDEAMMRPKPLAAFREALLMSDAKKREAALKTFTKELEQELTGIFKLVGERKMAVRLLNGPLTNFLPHDPEEAKSVYKALAKKHGELGEEELTSRASQMRNVNPMMGLRGSRIGISYPDVYEAHVEAILRAAYAASNKGASKVDLDLIIPGVMADAEVRFIRHGRSIESARIPGIGGVQSELMKEWGLKEFPFEVRIGAMIELPAASLMAGHMAKQSDYFSIDTNMLTQTTNGISQDDVNTFLPAFNQYDILKDNPFQILSTPVKELITATAHFGKMTRPDIQIGLSGDHASDPVNIEFAFRTKLNFVTCTPYGVPIAKLAVAQYLLNKGGA